MMVRVRRGAHLAGRLPFDFQQVSDFKASLSLQILVSGLNETIHTSVCESAFLALLKD